MKQMQPKKLFSPVLLTLFILLIVIISGILIRRHSATKPSTTTGVHKVSTNITQKLESTDLKPLGTLSDGWKTYMIPSGCYTFSLPPDKKPVYKIWESEKIGSNICPGYIDITLENNDLLEIATGVGGHGVPPSVKVTKNNIEIEGNKYEILQLTDAKHSLPFMIKTNALDPNQFYTLPTLQLDARPINSKKTGDLNNAELTLFNEILSTLKSNIHSPGWKKFSDNTYHFSLEYPDYFVKVINKLPTNPSKIGTIEDMVRFSTFTENPVFYIHLNPRFDGPAAPGKVYELSYKNNKIDFVKRDNPIPSNRPDIKVTSTRVLVGLLKLSEKRTYLFTLAYDIDDKSQNYEADFDKILESMQFPQN